MNEQSRNYTTQFHVAEGVEQALGSVAEMNDAGNIVLFDGVGSYTIPGRSPEAAMIRRAAAKCSRATKIHRRKNIFFIPIWVQPEKVNDSGRKGPFRGPGP